MFNALKDLFVLILFGSLQQFVLGGEGGVVLFEIPNAREELHAQPGDFGLVHGFEVDLELPPRYLVDAVEILILLPLTGNQQLLCEFPLPSQVFDFLLVVFRIDHLSLVEIDQMVDVLPQHFFLHLIGLLVLLHAEIGGPYKIPMAVWLLLQQMERFGDFGDLELKSVEKFPRGIDGIFLGGGLLERFEVVGEGLHGVV